MRVKSPRSIHPLDVFRIRRIEFPDSLCVLTRDGMEYNGETRGDKLIPIGQAIGVACITTSLKFPIIEHLVWILQDADMASEILRQLDNANGVKFVK